MKPAGPSTIFLAAFLGAMPAAHASALTNQLKDHAAPYLAWQRWGAEVVNLARRSDKILCLSVGYYACHWCHVMQRESYRNEEIAALINRDFLPVKIDRELEPALDARLMDFAQRLLGRGGWPLNVFITPDGQPIYAVLYLPPEQFLATLRRMNTLWSNERERVLSVVRREAIMARADLRRGGFGQSHKFPSAPQLQFLLGRYHNAATPDTNLPAMAGGGLHDHLAGGFFRYTVDPAWATPHFEKILLAGWNGLALSAFARAAAQLPDSDYAKTAGALRDFLVERLWDGERLSRARAGGRALDSESLEDYAYVAAELFHWAELSGHKSDYARARGIANAGWRRFHRFNGWRREDGTLLATPEASELIADDANASPAAVPIATSLKLADYFDDAALNRGGELLARAPFWYVGQLDAISLASSEYRAD